MTSFKSFAWIALCWLISTLLATLFSRGLQAAEAMRIGHTYLFFLLPIAFALSEFDQTSSRMRSFRLSSRETVRQLRDKDGGRSEPSFAVSRWGALWLIALTCLNHLFGASVGREGVGIQIGGWVPRFLQSKLESSSLIWAQRVSVASGVSVIFGAPLAGAAFVLESVFKNADRKIIQTQNITIGAFSVVALSWAAMELSIALGVAHFQFGTWNWMNLSFQGGATLALGLVLLSTLASQMYLRCESQIREHWSRLKTREPKRSYVFMTLLLLGISVVFYQIGSASALPGLGTWAYQSLLNSHDTLWEVPLNQPFVIGFSKLVLTAFFVGIGFRGGEVTPLLVIGAALSVGWTELMKIGPDLSTMDPYSMALGAALVWGIAAERPLTCAMIAFECFSAGIHGGVGNLILIPVVVSLCFVGVTLKKILVEARIFQKRTLYE